MFTLVTVYVSLSLKFRWLQRLLLNETMDVSSWNVGHVLKTAWKWGSWSLIWEQDGTNVSFIPDIHVRFLSCVISVIVWPTLPSSSSAVLLKLPIVNVRPTSIWGSMFYWFPILPRPWRSVLLLRPVGWWVVGDVLVTWSCRGYTYVVGQPSYQPLFRCNLFTLAKTDNGLGLRMF